MQKLNQVVDGMELQSGERFRNVQLLSFEIVVLNYAGESKISLICAAYNVLFMLYVSVTVAFLTARLIQGGQL